MTSRRRVLVLCLGLLAVLSPAGGWAQVRPVQGGWAQVRTVQGGWVPPVPGDLTVRRAFDPPAQRWLPGHRGVDVAATPGAPIRAVGAGIVTFAGVLAGRGVVTVTHGRLRSTYEPVRATVSAGEHVEAGDVLGLLAPGHGSPRPGEAVLHWGLLRGSTYLNPLSVLGLGPPRLLPHWSAPRTMLGTGSTVPSDNTAPPVTTAPQRRAHSAPPAALGTRAGGGNPLPGGAVVAALAVVTAGAALRRRGAP